MIKYSSCTIFFLILLISSSLLAKKILVEADYVFHIGSDISGKEACEGAEQKVREKAIREVAGETLNQKLIELCKFTDNADECIIHERTIRSLGRAKITYWEEIQRGPVVRTDKVGFYKCTYKARVEVKKIGKEYPGFDFKLDLNGHDFKAYPVQLMDVITNEDKITVTTEISKINDVLEITIKPQEDMFISVFQWRPNVNTNKFEKIFPNVVDQNNFAKKNRKFTIPFSGDLNESNTCPEGHKLVNKICQREYTLRLWFPEVEPKTVQENLWVIGTEENYNFDQEYSFLDFSKKIIELNRSSKKFREKQELYVIRKIDPSK